MYRPGIVSSLPRDQKGVTDGVKAVFRSFQEITLSAPKNLSITSTAKNVENTPPP